MIVYRFCSQKYQDDPLSGIGGMYSAGRWNHLGNKIIYTSDSPSLAQLEILVHALSISNIQNHILCIANIDDDFIIQFDVESYVGGDWRHNFEATREAGTQWINSNDSVGLIVPSVPCPYQYNVLINPSHKDFKNAVSIKDIQSFEFDSRITSLLGKN